MNRWKTGWAAFMLSAVTVLAGLAQNAPPNASEPGEIKMTAKKYQFDPREIRVKKGDHVKLVITALDREHGFKLEAFHIDQKLNKGEATTVEFTADRSGTFPFQCSHVCGIGHRRMKGELIVE